ncbi:MAG: DUF192 domain-containing protein [Thiomicrorhabdus sp.]|nr:DUF192 domain-containing protein [Thiomicrorhabdus sp.]
MTYKRCEMHCKDKNTVLFKDVIIPASFLARARGLLWREELKGDEGMLFINCNSIHMLGMRIAIDVVFLNEYWEVVGCVSNLKPWRMAYNRKAKNVLEVRQGMVELFKLRKGVKLECKML